MSGIKTQGLNGVPYWVEAFQISFSDDGIIWTTIQNNHGNTNRVFLGNFDNCVTLVTLYVKYVFTFQPDDVENLEIKKLRTKTFIWKILLSIIAILLNVIVQLSDDNQGTLVFKLLAKGQIFER